MRCPICGAKLKNEECPYCKITNKQVIYASNKKAKELLREKKSEGNVHTSNVQPKDVNKVKVWLFTIIGGMFGVDSFYVGKFYKGLYSLLSYIGLYVTTLIKIMGDMVGAKDLVYVFDILQSVFTIFGVVAFMMWFVGVINLITKKYKYPVVLPKEADAQRMYLDELAENQRKALEKEEKRNSK